MLSIDKNSYFVRFICPNFKTKRSSTGLVGEQNHVKWARFQAIFQRRNIV